MCNTILFESIPDKEEFFFFKMKYNDWFKACQNTIPVF